MIAIITIVIDDEDNSFNMNRNKCDDKNVDGPDDNWKVKWSK